MKFSLKYHKNNFVFSADQEKKKAILQAINQRSVREAWDENGGPPKSRSQWSQQPALDSAVFNRQSIMNDSCSPALSIQGTATNAPTDMNTPGRSQWNSAPRGTLINALEHANVYDGTLISTTNSQASDINLKTSANQVSPDHKNRTYALSSSKPISYSHPIIDVPQVPVKDNVVAEDLSETLKPQPQQDKPNK